MITHCPCCTTHLPDPFYRAGPVPVHSCLMLDDAETAAGFTTGDVVLAQCDACGFVTNTAFDPRWSEYAPNYEDQQSFSPTFNSFAEHFARDLIDRYDLSGKSVVEVGCSKGNFLYLLAERGGMQGVGIDPSALTGRVPDPTHGSLRLIPELYGPQHFDLPTDLLCCRHTLEHIQPVAEMLGLMRAHMERNPGSILCLDVPDATRIWQTGAFEDVYYEHCSYFTPGSLARALRRAGFAIRTLQRDYGDQYLTVEAVLDPRADQQFEIEESPEELRADIAGFGARVQAQIARWQQVFAQHDRLAIWGSGSKCVAFLKSVAPATPPAAIIDINPHRAGKFAPGLTQPISHPYQMPDSGPYDAIVVMNPIYLEEIADLCQHNGITGKLLPLHGTLEQA